MPFNELMAALRNGLSWFAAAVLVGLLAGLWAFLWLPRTYSSSASLYVSVAEANTLDDYSQGTSFIQGRIKTYPLIVTSVDVLDAATATLGDIDTSNLSSRVSAEVPVDSTLIVLTAEAPSGEDAAATVDAVAEASIEKIVDLETLSEQGSAVDIQVIDKEGIPEDPEEPQLLVLVPIGLMGGALVGLLIVVVRHTLRVRREVVDANVHAGEP